MGMYPCFKEIPPDVLDRLVARPFDSAATDALLFRADGHSVAWSDDATRGGRVGELHLGKYPHALDVGFEHFLGAVNAEIDLGPALERDLPPDVELERWNAIGAPHTVAMVTITGQVNGLDQCGFYTELVCYGINGYRRPKELEAVHALAMRGLVRFKTHHARLLERFGAELEYYEGCATRGSADLYVVW